MFKLLNKNGAGTISTLDQEHLSLMQQAKATAVNLARLNLPLPSDSNLEPHIAPIAASYRRLLNTHVKRSANDTNELLERERTMYADRQARLEKRLKELDAQHRQESLKRDELPEAPLEKKKAWVFVVLFLLGGTDALLTLQALSLRSTDSNLKLIGIFLGLLTAFLFLPHILVSVYRGTVNSHYRYIILGGLALFIVVVLFSFGVMRTGYVQDISGTSVNDGAIAKTSSLQPFYYLAIALLFLLIAVVVTATRLHSDEDEKKIMDLKTVSAQLAVIEQEQRETEAELASIPQRHLQQLKYQSELSSQESAKEAKINSMFAEAATHFITQNCLFRSDCKRPVCFDQPLPTL